MDIRVYRVGDIPVERIQDEFLHLFLARVMEYPMARDVSVIRDDPQYLMRALARFGGMSRLCAFLFEDSDFKGGPYDSMRGKEAIPRYYGIGSDKWGVIYDCQYEESTYEACIRDFLRGERREQD